MQTVTSTSDNTSAIHQFDFWIGDWIVSWGNGATGTNHVSAILDGRVIQENFNGQPAIPLNGMSVSTYDTRLQKWRQTWVDNQQSYIDLIGQFENNQMTLLTVPDDQPIRYRMIFYNITPNEFDWNWEKSDDQGNSWQLQWQIHYQRKFA